MYLYHIIREYNQIRHRALWFRGIIQDNETKERTTYCQQRGAHSPPVSESKRHWLPGHFAFPTFSSLAFPNFFLLHDPDLKFSSTIHQVSPWTTSSLAAPSPAHSTSLLCQCRHRSLSLPQTSMCSARFQHSDVNFLHNNDMFL